ncbi:MAG: hypothetical protein Q8S33_35010 [Myxococcales bacterium]|nr:hypothetical protein [Myxococcales bacterium]
MMRAASSVFLAVFVFGCEGSIGSSKTGGGSGGSSGGGEPSAGGSAVAGGSATGGGSAGGVAGVPTTQDVFTRLSFTCAGCHTVSQRPYFESLTRFQALLVNDRSWIVPGSPAQSPLLALLNGTGPRPMPPPPSGHFAVLEAAGQTRITTAELEAWIRSLQVQVQAPVVADPPHLRRKSVDQILRSLQDQLGLVEADLYRPYSFPMPVPGTTPTIYGRNADSYPARSPQALPPNDASEVGTPLYVALGGAHPLIGQPSTVDITPSFALTITHLSQSWCRAAVTKSGNTAFFTRASLTDTSTTGATNIRNNISDLAFKMLGEPPSVALVDDLFAVFVAYESRGAATAWTGVCAALVRDPLWLLY